MEEVAVEYEGIELVAVGEYDQGYPEQPYHRDGTGDPGESPSFDLHEIYHAGTNISEIIDKDIWAKIEQYALDALTRD